METNEVIRFRIASLRTGEQIEFFGLVNEIIANHDLQATGLQNAIIPFSKAWQKAEEQFKQSRNSDITSQLTAIDAARDNDIICLRMWADALTRHFEESKAKSATAILEVIDRYGSTIYKMNYEEQSATIRNLVDDLKTKSLLSDAISMLAMNELVDHLEDQNEKFRSLYMARLEEQTYNNEISAGEALKETVEHYRLLLKTIEAKAFLEPSEAILDIVAKINTLAQRQEQKISQRESSNEEEGQVI